MTKFLRSINNDFKSRIMKVFIPGFLIMASVSFTYQLSAQQKAQNPIIFADVPDMSMIRVGNVWYLTSTTMHMSPGGTDHEIK